MSNDVLVKLNLEFEKENKEEVYKILEKKDWIKDLTLESDDWVVLEFDYEIYEEDVKELKPYCENIYSALYTLLEGEGIYWENEDDELQRIVRKKINGGEK